MGSSLNLGFGWVSVHLCELKSQSELNSLISRIQFSYARSWELSQRIMSCECMFLGSLSHHNKDLEQRTLKPSARHSSWVLDKLCYSSQANQCYNSILFRRQQESEREKEREREKRAHTRRRESLRESALAPPFLYVFTSTWACPMQIGLSQECCLLFVLPEVFILVLRPSLCFSHHHFGLPFPILPT